MNLFLFCVLVGQILTLMVGYGAIMFFATIYAFGSNKLAIGPQQTKTHGDFTLFFLDHPCPGHFTSFFIDPQNFNNLFFSIPQKFHILNPSVGIFSGIAHY